MNLKKKNENKEESFEENEEEDEEQDLFNNDIIIKNKSEDNDNKKSDNNDFIISLNLLKKFNELNEGNYSDNIIINYIIKNGLPMVFKNEKYLSLYLYFHKICSSYYILFSELLDKNITDIIISLLSKNYYILADEECVEYNYNFIANKIINKYPYKENNKESELILLILNNANNDIKSRKEKKIKINKLILELAFESKGRLDIYKNPCFKIDIILY